MVTYLLSCWLHWTPPTSKDHYWTLMREKTLFKSFNNNNTKRKKRDKNKYQRKKKIGNNILVWYSLLDTKMENYKKQYTNKKRRQRIEIEMVTYFVSWWLRLTPPTSKDHYWTPMHHQMLFKSFNNNNTKGQKETRTNTK